MFPGVAGMPIVALENGSSSSPDAGSTLWLGFVEGTNKAKVCAANSAAHIKSSNLAIFGYGSGELTPIEAPFQGL